MALISANPRALSKRFLRSGTTCLSASGILYDVDNGIVITTGTLIAPFLEKSARGQILTKGTAIGVLLEEDQYNTSTSRASRSQKASSFKPDRSSTTKQGTFWRKAELVKVSCCFVGLKT